MKIKFSKKTKSISVFFDHKETIIRYWGKLKFDWFTIYDPNYEKNN
jgi:hypothetical protein